MCLESFKVLIKELQSLGLDLKVLDKNMEEIHLNDDDDDDDAYEDIVRGGGAQEEMGSSGRSIWTASLQRPASASVSDE